MAEFHTSTKNSNTNCARCAVT